MKQKVMKKYIGFMMIAATLMSCAGNNSKQTSIAIAGTWRLITGTIIENGDTTITHYTKDISFIKIINETHFAFLQHDLKKGQDSGAVFVAGGGRYTLTDSIYTEYLEYCSARDWEGNDFKFSVSVKADTLIQRGVEKVESAGVDRINIEKYVKLPD
jgi:hypothetical protein